MPIIRPDFSAVGHNQDIVTKEYDLIIMSQSCDLEHNKVRLVALCPVYSLAEFEKTTPAFGNKAKWNEVRRGRFEGLHLLASMVDAANNLDALVVDFREIYSLPFDYLLKRAEDIGARPRLQSPYLEHFSQTFARFFMRVGLPSGIPEFK